ncbi:MAG TPA: hypothetical protein VGC47_09260 [Acidimicrobiia bacterium]|jgi:hypothetical protein
MSRSTRRIGLSLGADLCWPIYYEDILAELDPTVSMGGETIDFAAERITIEPFDLVQPVAYDVVLDRLTPWYHTSREWIKKAVVMNGLYVLNNPFTLQAMQKHTSYAAMMRLGMPVPNTWLLPPKEYEHADDLHTTLEQYAQMFDLREVGDKVGYPSFLKPYDGGAWVGVSRIDDYAELQAAYDSSGTRIMHLQEAVWPFDLFVRALGVGPQVNLMRYDPAAVLHDRYKVEFEFVDDQEWRHLTDVALVINCFFGWDFNSVEALRKDGVFHPIDFANANPDSQVTSLHYHLPWLVKALLRWSLYCAATKRRMRLDLAWDPFLEIADSEANDGVKLEAMAAIARERFDAVEFASFCDTYLKDLDEVALAYFAEERAKDAIRRKVAAVFPAHEVDHFTEHFWGLIGFWRKTEQDRLSR